MVGSPSSTPEMPEDFNLTRRKLLRASAATAAGAGVVGAAQGDVTNEGSHDTGVRQIPCADFTDAEFDTETITTASEPVPSKATGIRPGSQIFIELPSGTFGCTANFIWRDVADATGTGDTTASTNADDEGVDSSATGSAADATYYVGAAGHCFLPTDKNAGDNAQREKETDEDTFDLSKVKSVTMCKECTHGGYSGFYVGGEVYELGDVVYARQNLPDGTQVGHDFGLVEIPDDLLDAVDPSIPQFGGPTGVEDGAVPQGETVCQYGAGIGNGEVYPTMASRGVSEGDLGTPESWYAGIRASQGDSGSLLAEYETGAGTDAAGVLTHLTTAGVAGTTIPRCIQMPVDDDLDMDLEVVLQGEDV